MNNSPSKEQIINQAIKFHLQGNIKEAYKYYQYCIERNINNHIIFSNYGLILKNLGKLKEAELYVRKAIQENPNYAIAHSNLGIILRDSGKIKDAKLCINKAIKLEPDFAIAHSNLGIILRDFGQLKEAELSLRKAIKLNSKLGDAYLNLGYVLKDLENFNEALSCFLKAIQITPSNNYIYSILGELLRDSDLSKFKKSELKEILDLLLKRNDINHRNLSKTFNLLYKKELIINLKNKNSCIPKIELIYKNQNIMNGLKKIIFKDPEIEKELSNFRKYICAKILKNIFLINKFEFELTIALGKQCFLNEYIYSLTKEEEISINKILDKCLDGELNEINIVILSCYYPLYKLIEQVPSLKSFQYNNKNFQELIKLQISEPIKEIELSKRIKRVGKIDNYISEKVKSQYEKNPYPRWTINKYFQRPISPFNIFINNEIKPNSINHSTRDGEIKVLIAGCGTGQHILNAQRYRNSFTTGIDLSLNSLGYAQRKISEFRIKNVELIQMDILEINLLKEKFDLIECSGVLHHMQNPEKGLQQLLSVLKNNGYLKLGLYSKIARKDIIKARNYITNNNIQSDEKGIRNFREKILSGRIENLSALKSFGDFYSLSECRDLCFHTEEHQFTINQLEKIITSNKLEFLGFSCRKNIKSLYKKYFPKDTKQTNLQNWAKFEEIHPESFIGMYEFWVAKINT